MRARLRLSHSHSSSECIFVCAHAHAHAHVHAHVHAHAHAHVHALHEPSCTHVHVHVEATRQGRVETTALQSTISTRSRWRRGQGRPREEPHELSGALTPRPVAHAGPVLRQVDVRQIAQHARRVVPRVGRRVFLAHVQLKPAVGEERVGGRGGRTRLPIIVIRTQAEGTKGGGPTRRDVHAVYAVHALRLTLS